MPTAAVRRVGHGTLLGERSLGLAPAKERRQFLRVLFTDPTMPLLYTDWEEVARLTIAQLRMDSVRNPDDPQLAAMVSELSDSDERFRLWWGMHDVALRDTGVKTPNHPLAGTLELHWNTLTSQADPGQQIVTWTAEPGSSSYDRLYAPAFQASS